MCVKKNMNGTIDFGDARKLKTRLRLHDDVIKWKHVLRYWHLWGEFTGEVPSQRPVTQNFDIFFDVHLNKWLRKQPRYRWSETP